jgi:serine/threonine protein kinase
MVKLLFNFLNIFLLVKKMSEDESSETSESRYELLKTLNTGITSKVMLALDNSTNKQVAIKIQIVPLDLKSESDDEEEDSKVVKIQEQIQSEILIYKQLSKFPHPNVICLLEVEEKSTTNEIWLIMEHCGGGDLMEKIEKEDKLSLKTSKNYFLQLLDGS